MRRTAPAAAGRRGAHPRPPDPRAVRRQRRAGASTGTNCRSAARAGYAPLPVPLGQLVAADAGRRRRAEEHLLPHRRGERVLLGARRRHGQPRHDARVRARGRAADARCTASRRTSSPPTHTRLPDPMRGPSGTPASPASRRCTSCSITTRTSSPCSPSTRLIGHPDPRRGLRRHRLRRRRARSGVASSCWSARRHALRAGRPPAHGRAARRRRCGAQPVPDGARLPAASERRLGRRPGPGAACDRGELAAVATQLASGLASVPCSSMGRLFDAVAAIARRAAADRLRGAGGDRTGDAGRTDAAPTPRRHRADRGRSRSVDDGVLDYGPVVRGLVDGSRSGVPPRRWPTGSTPPSPTRLASCAAEHCEPVIITLVGLTGGVFQNVLLLQLCRRRLESRGLEVLVHRRRAAERRGAGARAGRDRRAARARERADRGGAAA